MSRSRIALTDVPSRVGDVFWAPRANRYITLGTGARRVLEQLTTMDGQFQSDVLTATGANVDDVEVLVEYEFVVRWRDDEGLPTRARDVLALIGLNAVARVALKVGAATLLRRLVGVEPGTTSESTAWSGLRNERAVAAARLAAAVPGVDGRCLPMSLALWAHLRLMGIPASLRLGATEDPFAAHAWVESRGHRVDPAPVAFPGAPFTKADAV